MSKSLASMTEAELQEESKKYSTKSPVVALLLCLVHCHYFYAGRIGRGIFCLCTINFLYIGTVIDFIKILAGKFKDSQGLIISVRGQAIHYGLGNIVIEPDKKDAKQPAGVSQETKKRTFPSALYRNGMEYTLAQEYGNKAIYEPAGYNTPGDPIEVFDYDIRDTDWAVVDND